MNYIIMCDTDSDLPLELKEKYDIPVVQMPYIINGEEFYADLGKTYRRPEQENKTAVFCLFKILPLRKLQTK